MITYFYGTLIGTINQGQRGSGSNSDEKVFHIRQISKRGASASNGLVSYPGHWLVWFLCLMAYQLFLGYLMPKPFS